MRRGIPKMVTLHKLDDVIGNMTLRHAAMQKIILARLSLNLDL